jgi:ankyrin repeat protein
LLKNGAIINGTNALQLAAVYGKLGMVRLLVEAGGDVNGMLTPNDFYHGRQDDPPGTALHYAAECGAKDVVHYLMDNGADASKLDSSGYTAVERANFKGHDDIVHLIKSHEVSGPS